MFEYDRRTSSEVAFNEAEVKLAKTMMDKLRTTVEFLYYLMDSREKLSFTMILISADDLQLAHLLPKWKRQTDVLIEIDKDQNVYAIICQATDKEGAQVFGEILMSNIYMHGGKTTYCVETELKNTQHTIQEVIFNMVEKYIYIKQEQKSNHVYFATLKSIRSESSSNVTYYTPSI